LGADGITVKRESDRPAAADTATGEVADQRASAGSHVVRVDLERLDALMKIVGDLVISRARLADSLGPIERLVPAAIWRPVQENTLAIDRHLRLLREAIMRVRLVPVGEIFRRMPFVVRDLARESEKRVGVELHGQSTEIDKYVIERMMEPVVHLVRNAVTHGIETPEERIAGGKRPEGTMTLTAGAVGETVTLEIADDGRGVDVEAVVTHARATGLSVPPGLLDGAAVLSLLCAPGFSTKKEADRGSGRGVGMAVVKQTVEELSGTLELETTPGAGSRFVIHLPLTLAIADAIVSRVGTEVFAVPQGAVREVIQVAVSDIRDIEENEIVPHRGGALPIVRLARLFGIHAAASERLHVLVVGTGSAAIGFAVDRIVGQREIVVRAIKDPLVKVEGVSGATDLGDGRVVLILDPGSLARLTRQRAARALGRAAEWGRVQTGTAS
jgi:two-component system chemotaxis sensor kinase CheA